jgi:hypothetical protein
MKVTLHRVVWKRHEKGGMVPELFKVVVEKSIAKDGHYYTFPDGMDRPMERYFFLNPGERYVKASFLLNTYPGVENLNETFKNAIHHNIVTVTKLRAQLEEATTKNERLMTLWDREGE